MVCLIQNNRIQSFFLILLVYIIFGNYFFHLSTSTSTDEFPVTSNEDFFKVAIDFFDIEPQEYRLIVTGEVYNSLNLSLEEIKAMPVTSEIVRLTCVEYTPRNALTGVANWTGVKLSYILDMAEINLEKAIDISFHTPDLSKDGYSTSLSLEEAYWDDVIIAYEMNEEPLPKDHGYPLRLVCPRFYGYKWIKWLVYVNVTSNNYHGFWESIGFDDSPYVDKKDLQIYYYPLRTDIEIPQNHKTDLIGFELFLTSLTAITASRTRKKKI